jgi:hypothetical protein
MSVSSAPLARPAGALKDRARQVPPGSDPRITHKTFAMTQSHWFRIEDGQITEH